MLEKRGRTKHNALTLVFCSCSLCPVCAVWWPIYENYLRWRLHKYVSNDVISRQNSEKWFSRRNKMFICINKMCNCLTRYVRIKILNVSFNNSPNMIINNSNKSVSVRRNPLSIKIAREPTRVWLKSSTCFSSLL